MNKPDQHVFGRTKTKSEWAAPRITRMAAGDAEGSANPIVPDGQIAQGS